MRMANCQKCNYKLRFYNWRQTCPKCGTNLILYGIQERLMQDADKAEVQHYHFQKKLDRLKGSFVGSKLAIARIFTSLFPILALLLPFADVKSGQPFYEYSGKISLLTIFNELLDHIDIGAFSEFASAQQTRAAGICFIISASCLAVSIVAILVHFICLTLACSPHGKQRNIVLDAIMLICAAAAVITFACIPENSAIAGAPAIGAYVYLLLIVICFVIDFLTIKQGIKINHKPCFVGGIPIEEYFEMVESGATKQELRAEMYARMGKIQAEKDAELALVADREIERFEKALESVRSNSDEAADYDKKQYRRAKRKEERNEKLKLHKAAAEEKYNSAVRSGASEKRLRAYLKKLNSMRAKCCELTYDNIFTCLDSGESEQKRAADAYELFYCRGGLNRATNGRVNTLTLVMAIVCVALICACTYFIKNEVHISQTVQTMSQQLPDTKEAQQELDRVKGEMRGWYGVDDMVVAIMCAVAALILTVYLFGKNKRAVDSIQNGSYRLFTCKIDEIKIFNTDNKIQYRIKYTYDRFIRQQFVPEGMYKVIKDGDYVTCIDFSSGKKSFFSEDCYAVPLVSAIIEKEEVTVG